MESIEGTVILHPIAAMCQVNGLPVGKSQRISQGEHKRHIFQAETIRVNLELKLKQSV